MMMLRSPEQSKVIWLALATLEADLCLRKLTQSYRMPLVFPAQIKIEAGKEILLYTWLQIVV